MFATRTGFTAAAIGSRYAPDLPSSRTHATTHLGVDFTIFLNLSLSTLDMHQGICFHQPVLEGIQVSFFHQGNHAPPCTAFSPPFLVRWSSLGRFRCWSLVGSFVLLTSCQSGTAPAPCARGICGPAFGPRYLDIDTGARAIHRLLGGES